MKLLRAYLARPKIHAGPAFEWWDGLYALVVLVALIALAGFA